MNDKQNISPDSAKIISVALTNYSGATKDIRAQLYDINIFEDINYPVVRAEVRLLDAIDLVKTFPIIGEEILEISFTSLINELPITYRFAVYSMDGMETFGSGKGSMYTLKCVSEEFYLNGNMVDRSYTDISSNIIKDILFNDLKTSKHIMMEASVGIQNIVIPKLSPFAAIDFIRQRSVAQKPTGGIYVFYENRKGFNFNTIETLLTNTNENTLLEYVYSPLANAPEYEGVKYSNMLNFEYISKFNTANKIINGVYSSRSKSFNIRDKSITDINYDLLESQNRFKTPNGKSVLSNTTGFVSRTRPGNPTTTFMAKDSTKANDQRPEFIAYKKAFIELFNETVVRCHLYGNTTLYAGRSIKLKLPEFSSIKEGESTDSYSGIYLITRLRHIITNGAHPTYHVTVDCNRLGNRDLK